jgi:hypothetical protein
MEIFCLRSWATVKCRMQTWIGTRGVAAQTDVCMRKDGAPGSAPEMRARPQNASDALTAQYLQKRPKSRHTQP